MAGEAVEAVASPTASARVAAAMIRIILPPIVLLAPGQSEQPYPRGLRRRAERQGGSRSSRSIPSAAFDSRPRREKGNEKPPGG